jgi:hypothetical protein
MVALPPAAQQRLARAAANARIPLPALYDKLSAGQRAIVRATYAREQDGACCHCAHPLDGPPVPAAAARVVDWSQFPGKRTFLRHPVHLRHDHRTGLTIGAVHAYCNAVLWQYHGE